MYKIASNIKLFAQEKGIDVAFFNLFRDYWNHSRYNESKDKPESIHFDRSVAFGTKEDAFDKAFRGEIVRMCGAAVPGLSLETLASFANHPVVKYNTFAIVESLIDFVIPETIIDSIGLYTDVKVGAWGDSFSYDIKSRDLFVVSKAGKGKRQAEVRRQYTGQVTLLPEMHEITVGVELYKVLAGQVSLAEFTAKAVRSIESQMTYDAFYAFNTAMGALDNAGDDALRVAGYTQTTLLDLAQKVSTWNGGNKAVVVGTPQAVRNVLPDNANYRYMLDSDYVRMGYIPTINGYDVMMIPQLADWRTPFKLLLDDTKLYVMSPSAQKIVRLALEGSTLSNVDGVFANANLTQNATLWKSWGTAVATNAVAATIELA